MAFRKVAYIATGAAFVGTLHLVLLIAYRSDLETPKQIPAGSDLETPKQIPAAGKIGVAPKVAMLFLIRTEVWHPELWDFWLTEAAAWSRSEFIENTTGNEVVINSYVHHDYISDRDGVVRRMPKSLRECVVEPVALCRWGSSNPCMIRLLEAAVLADTMNEFFVYVSESHVPLTRFRDIYANLIENPRSRIFISNLNFFPTPKHDQWVVLNRRHALQLLANRSKWDGQERPIHVYPSGRRVQASDNEFFLLNTLLSIAASPEALWGELNYGMILPKPENTTQRLTFGLTSIHTFVCWKGACKGIGEHPLRPRPVLYTTVNVTEFHNQILTKGYWFARKFASNCTVLDDTNGKVLDDTNGKVLDDTNESERTLSSWLIEKMSHSPHEV